MKKVLFLMVMMVAAAFASPLFTIDSSKVGCATSKSQAVKDVELIKTATSDGSFVKVNILHKDTMMYSWGEGIDNKILGISGGYIQNINADLKRIAVVCYPRGEGGV